MGLSLTKKSERKVLILGADGSGKTTILYNLKLGKLIDPSPTLEYNMENITYKGKHFSVWDIRDNTKRTTMMTQHFLNVAAILYVIDTGNRGSVEVIEKQFKRLTNHECLKDVPLLVVANKQDVEDAMTVQEIKDKLNLHDMGRTDWHVQPTCALTGEGLLDALYWIWSLDEINRGNNLYENRNIEKNIDSPV